jgi:dCMP deaminase
MNDRLTRDAYYVEMTKLISARSTCPRKKIGAILVDKDSRVVGSGYNGSPTKMDHCTDAGCLLVKEGDTEHCVRTVHAEQNALLQAGRKAEGGTLYCNVLPCPICFKMCIQAGIKRIVYLEDYNKDDLDFWIKNGNVEIQKWCEGSR